MSQKEIPIAWIRGMICSWPKKPMFLLEIFTPSLTNFTKSCTMLPEKLGEIKIQELHIRFFYPLQSNQSEYCVYY